MKNEKKFKELYKRMKEKTKGGDIEYDHMDADYILVDMIELICMTKYGSIPNIIKNTLDAYHSVPKWYA